MITSVYASRCVLPLTESQKAQDSINKVALEFSQNMLKYLKNKISPGDKAVYLSHLQIKVENLRQEKTTRLGVYGRFAFKSRDPKGEVIFVKNSVTSRKEILAFFIDRILGFNLIPVTTMAKAENAYYIISQKAPGKSLLTSIEDQYGPEHIMPSWQEVMNFATKDNKLTTQEWFKKVNFFDYIIGNIDRVESGLFISSDGSVKLINHENSFHETSKLSDNQKLIRGQNLRTIPGLDFSDSNLKKMRDILIDETLFDPGMLYELFIRLEKAKTLYTYTK